MKLLNCTFTEEELNHLRHGLGNQILFFQHIFDCEIKDKTYYGTVYDTEANYIQVAKEHKTRHTLGFYTPTEKRLHLFKHDNFKETFQHELSHAIFDELCSGYNGWFDEGIAEYNEGMILTDSLRQVGVSLERVLYIRELLKQGFSLKNFVNLSYLEWKKLEVDTRYGMAWAVVFFLYSSDEVAFKDIVHDLCSATDIMEAISLDYPGGFDLFEANFRSFYLNRLP